MDISKFFFGTESSDEESLTERLLPVLPSDLLEDVLGNESCGPTFEIQEAVFPNNFVIKKQCRVKGQVSVQKIFYDEVKLNLIFKHNDALSWVRDINVYIYNTYNCNSSKIKQLISKREIGTYTLRIEFDLNNVENMDVYKLQKTTVADKKKFHCRVEVTYINDNTCSKNTKQFVVLGTPPKASKRTLSECEEGIETGETKRSKSNSFDSVASNTSSIDSGVLSPDQAKVMEVSRLVAENISTKTLEIDGTFYGQKIQTNRHDIGYHFRLRNTDEIFKEGEVVGFLPTDDDDVDVKSDHSRRQVVTKLTFETAQKTLLKGVVTHEPYIEAYCPKEENVRSEVICMMGIVPVQVVGSVKTHEFLYASVDYPGKATSGYHLGIQEKKDASFVGIAFSSRDTDDETSFGFVEAGVSLLQEASQVLVNQKLREVEKDFGTQIKSVKKSNKKWRCCTTAAAILFISSLALLGIYLWQYYTPGSAYRIAMCREGHKKPLTKAWFTYIPTSDIYQEVETTGIEFDFDVLMKKTHQIIPRIPPVQDNFTVYTNNSRPRYYLNIDRCAYGNDKLYIDKSSGRRIYRGPELFVIDEKCIYVFYYYDSLHKWQKYNSADWTKFHNVHCDPHSKFKTKASLITDDAEV